MNKYIVGILFTGAAVGGALYFFKQAEKPHFGTVIILNGPSGSGKSTIQREFQKLMLPNLWVKVGIDNLFDMPLPDVTAENMEQWQTKNPIRWVEHGYDVNGNPVISLFVGDEGQKVVHGMNSAIAAYARNGCNAIVDYIAYKEDWLKDLKEKLADIKVYYVAVDIPLEVLEQREIARGTSPKGHARSHYATVYGDMKYDLRVNSHMHNAIEIAQQLKNMIEK
jgi:chloramphenicol 3-O phosphotransferase